MDAKSIRLENLKRLIQEAGSQKNLAARTGVNPAYISQILSRRTPRSMGDDVARRLERGMEKSHGWMDVIHSARGVDGYRVPFRTGVAARAMGDIRDHECVPAGKVEQLAELISVPVINWVTAGQWPEMADAFRPGDADGWVDIAKRVGPATFALRVRGDSMEPLTPDGAMIIVDPDREAGNGSMVVARLDGDEEATFKKLVIDGARRYLTPINPRYPVLEISGSATICGVVRQVLIDLD